MPVLKTLVEPETKIRFQAMAKARGLSESELLRALVLAVDQEEGVLDMQPVKPELDKLDQERITVRMPRFLMEAVNARGRLKGMAPSRFITAMIQSNLTKQPVMTGEELNALQETNRELVAIGRNLNQIARSLNGNFYETERIKLDSLRELKQVINKNVDEIRNLVRASNNSWNAN
jgi:predicted DNA binding CopG/RHH family protein